MTNQEAIRILNEQRNKFMDEWVDYCGINEAYNMAIQALKEQEAVRPEISETATYHNGITSFHRIYSCGSCNEKISGDASFCQNCGKAVKWE